MRFTKTIRVSTLVLTLALTLVLWADEKGAQDFKSPQVRAARAQFNSRVADIQLEANTKIATARKKYIAELQKAMDASTRGADLREANRLQAELEAMQKELPAMPGPLTSWQAREALASALTGTSWKLADNLVTLMADGTISPQADGMQGLWAPIGNRAIVITLENGWTDLWLFDEKLTTAKVTHAQLGGDIERKRIK